MPEGAGIWGLVGLHVLVSVGSAFALAKLLRLLSETPPDEFGEEDEEQDGGGGGGGGTRRGPRGPWGGGLPLGRLAPWPRRLRDVTRAGDALAARSRRVSHRRGTPERPLSPRRDPTTRSGPGGCAPAAADRSPPPPGP